MKFERLQEAVYQALPEKYRERMEEQAKYAHMDNYESINFNIISIFTFILLMFVGFFPTSWVMKSGVAIVALPTIIALPYVVISIYANNRRKEVEEVLPVALNLISSNMKSGLTVDRAFLLSAREEFGPLADDLKKAAMKMFGGDSVSKALTALSKSTNSELFQETLNLLKDGIETGGQVSKLLESSAKDVQKSLRLREEIAANVKMYSIFIIIASVLGAPILFSVSVHLSEETSSMWASDTINFENLPSSGGGFTPQEPSFRPEFFADFAVVALIISNIFAAMLISEIKNGNIKDGIKFAPIYAIVAVAIFFLANFVIGAVM